MISYPKNHYFSNHLQAFQLEMFDDIYNKQITKNYTKQEIKRLFKGRERKRDIGARRAIQTGFKR